ncbi:hypothetical protein A6U86_28900 [Rhizobium sp. AC27/96]|uniref:HAMP domain-containing sensor histidine kinase n=1 Tax=Rhizobium TaxID=379 RepID=UPI0008278CCE|nr:MULTISPECIES: HAMP domain-containing sensor histidine kinase [Rhizobium]OCJ07741.1 hypothetical protein A6U86_28900 [Rhizobium sp. AC27/96]
MSKLFWKLFVVVWLSIAGLICVLILLTNVFGFQPPQREFDLRKQRFLIEIAEALVVDHNLTALPSVARMARTSGSPIDLKVSVSDDVSCAKANGYQRNERYLSADQKCYRITADFIDNGAQTYGFLIFPFLVDAVASLIAACALAYYLAGPIVTLKDGLNALARGDFRIRIGKKFGGRQDEISDLGLDFDSTASKLQALQEIQQRLYHDVSHELRSPLSRIQAAIGVLRQNPSKLDAMMERMDREIERLDTLVDEILTLAKLNTGYASSFEKSKIDIIDLLGAIVDDAGFEAKAKGVVVRLEGVASFVSDTNGELIYRALENVVRNAVKYTADETEVIVDAHLDQAHPHMLRITVCDHGPGVPDDEIERIFEPFQRGVDSAEVTGHGLGLAIARQTLEIQGGSVRAENGPNSGLRIIIQIAA